MTLLWLTVLLSVQGAYVRSRACSEPNSACSRDPQTHCTYWQNTDIPFTQNSQGDPNSPDSFELTAVSRSFSSWQAVSDRCGSLRLRELPNTLRRTIGFDPSSSDNQNLVLFRRRDCTAVAPSSDSCWGTSSCGNRYDCWMYSRTTIALTTVSFDSNTGRILDADLEMNAASNVFTTVDSPICPAASVAYSCVATDVQNTVTHEVGHLLGLDHTPDLASTMYANAPQGETRKRSLDADSQQFVCDVYPTGRPPQDCVVVAAEASSKVGQKGGCSQGGMALWPALGMLALLSRGRRGGAPW